MAAEPTARPMNAEVVVRDNSKRSRYEAYVGHELAGFAIYHLQPGFATVLHTEIEPAFEGQGLGSELVGWMLDDIRRKGARVLPVCPFLLAFLRRHRECDDLVWEP